MAQEKRRKKIIAILTEAQEPVTGSSLSSELGVTRQIIVGDMAVLRASGEDIVATPQGYILYKGPKAGGYRSTIAVRHGEQEKIMADELNLIVDLGGVVENVTVEHPLYGELTANLQIVSRSDVEQFVEKMRQLKAEPLSILTDGYHLHSIVAPSAEAMGAIREKLRTAGYLAE